MVHELPSPSWLRAAAVDSRGVEHAISLRARRLAEGGPSYAINTTTVIPNKPFNTYFRIQCLASDNPGLPAGAYKGQLVLQLTGKDVPKVIESIFIDIDIDIDITA